MKIFILPLAMFGVIFCVHLFATAAARRHEKRMKEIREGKACLKN